MKKIALILILFICTVSKTLACGCGNIPFQEATEWADEIFLGRVIEIREVSSFTDEDGTKYGQIWVTLFEIEKKWKGSSDAYVEVYQAGTSCDFTFDYNSRPYIVYAAKAEIFNTDSSQKFAAYSTWLCQRNAAAYTYESRSQDGFDDRPRLTEKYGAPVLIKPKGYSFDWKNIIAAVVIFVLGAGFGRILTKTDSVL